MVKKSNSGPGQNGKPQSIPNKEIIQRMNFLHQAAVLVSGALYTPTVASTSKQGDNAKSMKQHDKQTKTTLKAQDMVQSGQYIGTQPESFVTAPPSPEVSEESVSPELSPAPVAQVRATKKAIDLARAKRREAKSERRFLEYCVNQGLTPEQVAVRVNRRRKSFQKKQAKASMASLEVGNANYKPTPDEIVEPLKGRGKKQRKDHPKHPSQVEHRNLACHYVNDIRTMARKNVLRMDPSIKRTMCRNCNALLIPCLTSSVRILPSATHVHLVRTKCLACNVARSIPAPPLHPVVDPVPHLDNLNTEEFNMQGDATPVSAGTSTSRTLSESSAANVHDEGIAAPVDTLEERPDEASMAVEEAGNSAQSKKQDKKKPQKTAQARKNKRQPGQQRKKIAADPLVPGKKGQYTHLRFHERPEYVIMQINKPAV